MSDRLSRWQALSSVATPAQVARARRLAGRSALDQVEALGVSIEIDHRLEFLAGQLGDRGAVWLGLWLDAPTAGLGGRTPRQAFDDGDAGLVFLLIEGADPDVIEGRRGAT